MGTSIVSSRCSLQPIHIPMNFHGLPRVFLWFSYGFTMFSYVFPMFFHFFMVSSWKIPRVPGSPSSSRPLRPRRGEAQGPQVAAPHAAPQAEEVSELRGNETIVVYIYIYIVHMYNIHVTIVFYICIYIYIYVYIYMYIIHVHRFFEKLPVRNMWEPSCQWTMGPEMGMFVDGWESNNILVYWHMYVSVIYIYIHS